MVRSALRPGVRRLARQHSRTPRAPPGAGGVAIPVKENYSGETYERTNLSRLAHLGFLGLNFMNLRWLRCQLELLLPRPHLRLFRSKEEQTVGFTHLLKRTWETGAMPMGAPGCPEFAAFVASTCGEDGDVRKDLIADGNDVASQ